jgi:hypothetical protein
MLGETFPFRTAPNAKDRYLIEALAYEVRHETGGNPIQPPRVFATQLSIRPNYVAKTSPRVNACAAKPTGSGKPSLHRQISPNPSSKPPKSNFVTSLDVKIPPLRAFGFHLGSGDGQLGRAQDPESGSSEKKLEDRRTFLIPNQEIRLARGVRVHRTSRRNPESFPSASPQVLNRGASPRSQNLENRNGTHFGRLPTA